MIVLRSFAGYAEAAGWAEAYSDSTGNRVRVAEDLDPSTRDHFVVVLGVIPTTYLAGGGQRYACQ